MAFRATRAYHRSHTGAAVWRPSTRMKLESV